MKKEENQQVGETIKNKFLYFLGLAVFIMPLIIWGYQTFEERVAFETLNKITRNTEEPYAIHSCSQADKLIDKYNDSIDYINRTSKLATEAEDDFNDENFRMAFSKANAVFTRLKQIQILGNIPMSEMSQDQFDYVYGILVTCSGNEDYSDFDAIKDKSSEIRVLKYIISITNNLRNF